MGNRQWAMGNGQRAIDSDAAVAVETGSVSTRRKVDKEEAGRTKLNMEDGTRNAEYETWNMEHRTQNIEHGTSNLKP